MSREIGSLKTGGRQKGTPNKVSAELKEWVQSVIDSNKKQFETDLQVVEPEKRLAMLEKLLQYVLPKQREEVKEEETKVRSALYDKFFNNTQRE